jgi:RHS repeat-associated protein
VLLTWDPVAGADAYRLYKLNLERYDHQFHLAAVVPAASCSGTLCEYSADGADDGDCPWPGECNWGTLHAYYVVAVEDADPSPAVEVFVESPRSNLVLWHFVDGYVKVLDGPGSWEALAQLERVGAEAARWCEAPALTCEADPVGAVLAAADRTDPRPHRAPLVKLGQTSAAFEILNLHVDHLGSTRVVTDGSGAIVSQHDFHPFGEEIAPTFDYSTKRFTGHERDEETGLDYMSARYYGSSLGRFLSVDPSRRSVQAMAPQTWNRYSYAVNNPINRVDPDGEVSYLVARNGPGPSSHMFIVTHARYPGDPNARIHSWGKSSKKGSEGKVGKVDKKTTGLSKGTAETDRKAWESLGTGDAKGVDYTGIAAKDGKVASVADAVVENKDYGLLGPNSNSAAQAVADTAQGSEVTTPEAFDPAVGAEDSDEIEFDEEKIEEDEAAGKHDEHVPAEKKPTP